MPTLFPQYKYFTLILCNGCQIYYYNLSLDTTDEEARSQFLEEIEIMKAIGSHKNIVSMLGCWVHSDPIFLMLEYVPYGDLKHWLRNKRIQVDFTLIRTLCEGTMLRQRRNLVSTSLGQRKTESPQRNSNPCGPSTL